MIIETSHNPDAINWGHFGVVLSTMVLLLGVTWMQQPQLFSFKKSSPTADVADAPKYYAYVEPAEDHPPLVAGASTNQGPSVINEDGTVSPVDMGQVLGASTQDVKLALDDVKVDPVPDSDAAIKKYFSDIQSIESSPVDNSAFESALSSNDQAQINAQAQKLIGVRDALQKMVVPQSLVKLQQLKIAQYNSAIGVLQNFTQADSNPQLVGDYLNQFLKSQQDLDTETNSVVQKFPNDVPEDVAATASVPAPTGTNTSDASNAQQ